MATANRRSSFLATMRWEGGDKLSLDKRDSGNWTGGRIGVGVLKGTKWGVAASAHPTLDIAKLTADEALSIFLSSYWRPIGADDLPAGLDHAVSDDAYNSGPSAALQRLRRIEAGAAGRSVVERIQRYSQLRLSFLESLKSWRIFKGGWAHRVAGVEAESLKMALEGAPREAPLTISRDGFLTPADVPPVRLPPSPATSIVRMQAEADSACGAARRRVALVTAMLLAAATWRHIVAPAWLLGGAALAATVLVASLWAWRAHGARRDALARLVDDLSPHAD